jgi:hypothetical protein
MFGFLVNTIYLVLGDQVFQQTVGIPMGTNCAYLLANFFLYSYEAEFVQNLLQDNNKTLAMSFNHTITYIYDVLFDINICPHDLSRWTQNKGLLIIWQICNVSRYFTWYWLQWYTLLYDKRDDFVFAIVNFHFLCSNVPLLPAYGLYISQLILYAIACFAYEDFSKRGKVLKNKLMLQGYNQCRLKWSFRKFYGRYNDLFLRL